MAGKKKTASKAEVFYIKSNPENKDAQTLADELGLMKETVDAIFVEMDDTPNEPQTNTNKMEGLIINRTEKSAKKRMAIMTEAGSTRVDDANKEARAKIRGQFNETGVGKTYPNGRPN